MRAFHRDQIVGAILLVIAVTWTVIVYATIDPGSDSAVGPRAFPMWLGILLAGLSTMLLISGFRQARAKVESASSESDENIEGGALVDTNLRMVATVFGIIVTFGFLMEKIGFVLATILIVTGSLWFALGVRRPVLVAGMAFGMAFGCWVVFGQMLGAYLPPGTWISLF